MTSFIAKKSLGQHFLHSPNVVGAMIHAARIEPGTKVLEIGPGKGILTEGLLKAGALVTAVEKDERSVEYMRENFAADIASGKLKIVQNDVLETKPRDLGFVKGDYVIAANIPYYITSDILLWLFANAQFFDEIILMTQLEVADRIAASAGSRDYGLLSATTQLFARVEKLFEVPAEAFAPPPKVESAVLRLKLVPRWSELQVDPASFQTFLKASFAQKRKTLSNNLRAAGFTPAAIAEGLERAELPAQARAEACGSARSIGTPRNHAAA